MDFYESSDSSGESSVDWSHELWTPSEDKLDQKESEQGHLSKNMYQEIHVKKKVDDFKEAEGTKEIKTWDKPEGSTSQRRKISCTLVVCKVMVVHLPRHM